MDLLSKCPYLDRTMMRRLLTLLAVLTGFAVIGAPVQAQPSQSAAAACEASALTASVICVTPAALALAIAVKPGAETGTTAAWPSDWAEPATVPVRLRIDRARE